MQDMVSKNSDEPLPSRPVAVLFDSQRMTQPVRDARLSLRLDGDVPPEAKLRVRGLPIGATLSVGQAEFNGDWTMAPADAAFATVVLPAHVTGPLRLTAEAIGSDALILASTEATVTVEPDPQWRDGQDDIDASKAPLMEHLIELRQRLIHSLIAFFGFFIVCYAFSTRIFKILVWPYERKGGEGTMQATHLLEELFTNIKLAMFGAAFLAFPFAAYQIYKFVAPGLYKNEKEAFRPYLLWTWLLFILGAMVVYFVIMPMVVAFSVGDMQAAKEAGQPKPFVLAPKISEYLSLIMQLILGFGIIFQLPVVLALLAQGGVVTAQGLRDFSRYAIVAITAVSAVLSPPDPFSMLAMMAPTVGLYYVGIWVVQRIENARAARDAADKRP